MAPGSSIKSEGWAITGAVTSQDVITHIEGYLAKLEAARAEKLKVIVPSEDFEYLNQVHKRAERSLIMRGTAVVADAIAIMSGPRGWICPCQGLEPFHEGAVNRRP